MHSEAFTEGVASVGQNNPQCRNWWRFRQCTAGSPTGVHVEYQRHSWTPLVRLDKIVFVYLHLNFPAMIGKFTPTWNVKFNQWNCTTRVVGWGLCASLVHGGGRVHTGQLLGHDGGAAGGVRRPCGAPRPRARVDASPPSAYAQGQRYNCGEPSDQIMSVRFVRL